MNDHKRESETTDEPTTQSGLSRRRLLGTAIGGVAAAAISSAAQAQNTTLNAAPNQAAVSADKPVSAKRIQQSVCQWCFGGMPLEKLAEHSAKIGLKGIDLVGPDAWPTLKKYGLVGTMTPTHGITKGLNRKENHEECLSVIRRAIEATADAGFPNVICFSGNRAGMSDAEGLQNCAIGLKQVVGLAEQRGVTICMELLNSKRDHGDYMCDHAAWGVELVKAVGSLRFKLLYDIYHMQVQEGDVIATFAPPKITSAITTRRACRAATKLTTRRS